MIPETHVYKSIAGCDILADVFRPEGLKTPTPAIIYFHGGALIEGSRKWANTACFNAYLAAGYAVVSADYRLAPETKLPAIIEDVRDALDWVRREGPSLFGVDPSRIAVSGSSAGGYLTLMAGAFAQPPKALLSFYGYGDVLGDWYAKPDPFYCREPLVTEAEALSSVGRSPVTVGAESRDRFYLYTRQTGTWPLHVGGRDPKDEPGFFKAYCPLANVSPDHPPTMLLHGDADTDVPYEESVMMARALCAAGVEHELVTIPGGAHGFDSDSENPLVKNALAAGLAFLERHLA